MRGQAAAADSFQTAGPPPDAPAGGGRKWAGLRGQKSWQRRKLEEQKAALAEHEQERLLSDERRRTTPLGRMESASLSVWKSIGSETYKRILTATCAVPNPSNLRFRH